MSDTLGYQPPGVYANQLSSGVLTSSSPTVPNTVALVGPTVGYFTNTDTLVLSTTSATPLSQQGINASTIVVSSGSTVYASSNYTVTQSGTGATSVTSIEIASGSSIANNSAVSISYQYTDANYFLPHRFTNFNAIQAAYGQGYSASGTLVSPITYAAQCLFANGSPNVVVQPTTDVGSVATRAGLSGAYPNLEALTDVYFIVPIAAGISGTAGTPGDVINVASDLASYISGLTASNQFAMGLYGQEYTSTVPAATIASTVKYRRLVTFYPNALNASSGNNNLTVAGYNVAAAAAGLLASSSVQQGLTTKSLSGFSGIPTSTAVGMTTSALNTIASSGVSILAPNIQAQALQIRHGLTTDMTSANTQEISVVRALDYVIYDMTATLSNSGLIGGPTTNQTAASIQSLAQSVLESNVRSGAILAYSALGCTLSSSTPTTASLTFSIAPAYPLNYIDVLYSINANGLSVSTSNS